jgi:hypothetical protein
MLSEAIKTARGVRTREEFAVIIGVTSFTVGAWERGDRMPRSGAHVRQLVAQGVPAASFIEVGIPVPATLVSA